MNMNLHYAEVEESYLFSTVAQKVNAFAAAHPEKEIIRLGIGDVTKPLCPAVIERMHQAVDEMGDAATFRGAHGIEGIRVNDPVMDSVNAVNPADEGAGEAKDSYTVDKEQILAWNPEYIFLDSGGVALVRQDYAERADFYASLDAVRNGRLYQYPSSTSYYDNMEISLANCYFVGSVLYPEAFAGVDFEAKAGEIFAFFLGDEDYLDVLEEYGAWYGPVELGE